MPDPLGFDAPPTKVAGHHMQFMADTHNPTDSTTYKWGFGMLPPQTTGASPERLYFPLTGSIRWLAFTVRTVGTVGSAETGNLYIRMNGVTDYELTNATKILTWNAVQTGFGDVYEPGFIPVIRDEFMEFVVITPAWVTNPTQVYYRAQIWVEA